jgi:hypothetical protein
MPQIIVVADPEAGFEAGPVTLCERVNVTDFESQHFATQLVERLGWAVEDAHHVERRGWAVEGADHVERRPAAPHPAASPTA